MLQVFKTIILTRSKTCSFMIWYYKLVNKNDIRLLTCNNLYIFHLTEIINFSVIKRKPAKHYNRWVIKRNMMVFSWSHFLCGVICFRLEMSPLVQDLYLYLDLYVSNLCKRSQYFGTCIFFPDHDGIKVSLTSGVCRRCSGFALVLLNAPPCCFSPWHLVALLDTLTWGNQQ